MWRINTIISVATDSKLYMTKQSFDASEWTKRPNVDTDYFKESVEFALERIEQNAEEFATSFPSAATVNDQYEHVDNDNWITGFWPGLLWLGWEASGDSQYRTIATDFLDSFEQRLTRREDVLTHDLGFLYSLTAVAAYRQSGNERARSMALEAAEILADRQLQPAGVIQAWGDPDQPDKEPWLAGRIIIDTMMNLPLLFWASEETGDDKYAKIATKHAERTAETIVRDDGSTFHTYLFDLETGEPLKGETHQGHADDSCWARGQTWTIYGFALAARYTNDERFTEISRRAANYYLAHLPSDGIPCWDLDFTDDDVQRDTSAAGTAACGFAELARQLPLADERKQAYENAALRTLYTLSEEYTTAGRDADGIIDEGVYNMNSDNGIGESMIWGDYFYMEGLLRATESWRSYW